MKKLIIILGILFSGLTIWTSCTQENDILGDGDSRDNFVGEWVVNDVCFKQTYRSNITLDPNNSAQVFISNFANLGYSASAIIAGTSIYVENQEVGGGYSVNGNGKITGSIIAWTSFNYENSSNVYNCTATFSKP